MRSERRTSWIATAIVAATVLGVAPARAATPRSTVAIVKSSTLPPFELATEALTASLRNVTPQPEILTFDLEGDAAKAPAVLLTVYAAEPRVIVTIGSLATSAVLAGGSPIPIVFSMVLYPKASGCQTPAH